MAEVIEKTHECEHKHEQIPWGKINAGLKCQFWVNHLNCWETLIKGNQQLSYKG